MNLTYRGICYQSQITTIEANKNGSFGRFRGHYYQLSQPIIPTARPSLKLVYRGISHNSF